MEEGRKEKEEEGLGEREKKGKWEMNRTENDVKKFDEC